MEHPAVHLGELSLDAVRDGPGVVQAGGVADEDALVVAVTTLRELVHELHHAPLRPALGAYLLHHRERAVRLHVHDGADLEQATHESRRLGDAPAPDEEGQVGREEPVLDLEAVLQGPGGELLDSHAALAEFREAVHEQSVSCRGGKGVDDHEPALGELGRELVAGGTGGAIGARYPGREGQVQHVPPRLEEGTPELDVVADGDLRGGHVRAGEHPLEELGGGVRATEVVLAPDAVDLVVEVHALDVARVEEVLRHVGGRAAAQYVVMHRILLMGRGRGLVWCLPVRARGAFPGAFGLLARRRPGSRGRRGLRRRHPRRGRCPGREARSASCCPPSP